MGTQRSRSRTRVTLQQLFDETGTEETGRDGTGIEWHETDEWMTSTDKIFGSNNSHRRLHLALRNKLTVKWVHDLFAYTVVARYHRRNHEI